jgi:hypothetical protein
MDPAAVTSTATAEQSGESPALSLSLLDLTLCALSLLHCEFDHFNETERALFPVLAQDMASRRAPVFLYQQNTWRGGLGNSKPKAQL